MQADVVIMAEDFHRLTLTRFRIEDRTDAGRGIVLACEDESGVMEALHNELVSHVSRSAVSSSFLARRAHIQAGAGRGSRRSLMIDRYGSPDVLGGFDLHFPLCTHPPRDPSARSLLIEQLMDAFRVGSPNGHLDVEQIHLLVRGRDEPHWQVSRTWHLGH
jgi:hypothetical protein